MTTSKIQALANFLNVEVDEIEPGYDDNQFSVGREEYLVCTDEEADELTKESILASLWAFKGSFIQSHSNLSTKAIKELEKVQAALCEGANELVKGVIKDLDYFIVEAVRFDGRGHFLSFYDGDENEEKIDGTWFFIYRTN